MAALGNAAKQGDAQEVARLIEKGASLDEKDGDGWTALMLASANGHKEVAALLIEKGASVDEKIGRASCRERV